MSTWRTRDVLVVDRPASCAARRFRSGLAPKRAIAVLAAMVVLLVTGAVPAAVAGLLAASAVVLLGVLSIDQAFRASRGRRSSWSPA